jgi:hypothetical protein
MTIETNRAPGVLCRTERPGIAWAILLLAGKADTVSIAFDATADTLDAIAKRLNAPSPEEA